MSNTTAPNSPPAQASVTGPEPQFDFAQLQRFGGLFTHRYCVKLLALCATEPHSRQALRVRGRASNAGLDGAIRELRSLGFIAKVIGDDDNPVFEITEKGREGVALLNRLSADLQVLWPETKPRA